MDKSYCEIDNINNPENSKRIMFYAEEKINGTNFRIITNGNEVSFGARDMIFTENDYWYNFRATMKKYDIANKTIALFNSVKAEHPELKAMTIYGELFGGYYPGFKSNSGKIIGDTLYTPDIEFLAYDICVEMERSEFETFPFKYLNEPYMKILFEELKIPYLKTLKIGMLNELFDIDLRINSTIPSYFGLPDLPEKTNFIEGIVIKPVYPMYYSDGKRVIIKKKNPEFEERKIKKQRTEVQFTFEENDMLSEIDSRITDNRFKSLLSKHPYSFDPMEKNIIGKLISSTSEEIFLDIVNEMTRSDMNLEALQNPSIKKTSLRSINALVRPFIVKMVQEKLQGGD